MLFAFFGLGKKRTKFGRWLDKEDISQIEVEDLSGLSRRTISRLCNDKDYTPRFETINKIRKALRKLGRDVPDDYFNL